MLRLGVLAAVLVLASGCTGEDDPSDATPAPPDRSDDLSVAAVSCPQVPAARQVEARLRAADPEAPPLPATITLHELTSRSYCVDATVWDASAAAERIVSYTVDLEDDRANYGETYTTSDPEGSEELLNFPFGFSVHGSCRAVTATVVLTDGGDGRFEYVARSQAGPGCPTS